MAQDFAQVLDYYREFLKHEDPSRQVSWRTPYDQELRFENLLEAIDDEGVGFSPCSTSAVGWGISSGI